MSDEQEIHNLLYRYARLIDAADFAGIAALFASAVITTERDSEGVRGDAIRTLYETANRVHEDGTTRTKHVTTNVELELDGEEARSRSYFTVFQQVVGFPLQPIVAGRYEDRFERADGRWRFASRHIAVDLVGDLTHHLTGDIEQLLEERPG